MSGRGQGRTGQRPRRHRTSRHDRRAGPPGDPPGDPLRRLTWTNTASSGASTAGGLRRRDRILIALLTGLVAAVAYLASGAIGSDDGPGFPALHPGDSPPDFVLPDLRDPSRSIASSDFFGSPTVVTFLSSTCVPCRTELPILQRLADEHRGRVRVVGIDHLEFRDQGLRFVEELGITFPVAHDEAGGTAVAWLVPALPATFFLSGDGRVVRSLLGRATEADLKSGLDAILR